MASDLWFGDVSAGGFVARLDTGRLPAGRGPWHLIAEVSVDGLVGRARVGILPWTMAGIPAWSDVTGRVLAVDHDDAGRFELLAQAARRSVVDVQVAGDTLVLRLPHGVREVALEPVAGGSLVGTAAVEGGRAELSLAGLRSARYAVVGRDGSGRRERLLQPPGRVGAGPPGPVGPPR